MTAVWTVLLMLVVVVGLRAVFRKRTDTRRAALGEIAAQLGLQARAFDALGTQVPGPTAPTTPPRPVAAGLTAAWGTRQELHGARNGRAVSIGALPARRYRVAIAAQCRLPRETGLWVTSRKAALAGPPPKTAPLQSGDPGLDADLQFAARDKASAERLLAQPAVHAALRDLGSLEAACVHDDWVYVTPYADVLQDVSAVRQLLDRVTGIAAALDRAVDSSADWPRNA